jgi:hypothetical protein
MSVNTPEDTSGQGAAPVQLPNDPMSVRMFHIFSDVDSDSTAQHHTIGPGVNQAASGAHNHDGSNSPTLFNGTISGACAGNTALKNLISALCSQTGFVDGTTA